MTTPPISEQVAILTDNNRLPLPGEIRFVEGMPYSSNSFEAWDRLEHEDWKRPIMDGGPSEYHDRPIALRVLTDAASEWLDNHTKYVLGTVSKGKRLLHWIVMDEHGAVQSKHDHRWQAVFAAYRAARGGE